MRKLMILLIVASIFFLIHSFISFLNQRDEELRIWAEKYEECILVQYGTSPSNYYTENNHYPTCETEQEWSLPDTNN